MRIVVYPHSLEVGGSQMNAVDFAGALLQRGHDVTVFGAPGELDAKVAALGLHKIDAPLPRIRPSPHVMAALNEHVHAARADIVHAFEWPPAVDSLYGPYRQHRVPVLCTIMSMAVAPFLPRALPLTVGTRELLNWESAAGRSVGLLEPPVDVVADRPRDQAGSKYRLGIAQDTRVIAIVSRFAEQLKLEGILAAIGALGSLAAEGTSPVQLVIAGDGPARATIEDAASRTNARAGRRVIVMLGQVADPRVVYDAADVVLGMGGSALRAMAFAKPLVVQGELGFWSLLSPESHGQFLSTGWYGVGAGDDGTERLLAILRPLLRSSADRIRLGTFARQLVESRYSLARGAESLEARYLEVIRASAEARIPLVRGYASVTRYELARKVRRRLGGTVARDDFNAVARMPGVARIGGPAYATVGAGARTITVRGDNR